MKLHRITKLNTPCDRVVTDIVTTIPFVPISGKIGVAPWVIAAGSRSRPLLGIDMLNIALCHNTVRAVNQKDILQHHRLILRLAIRMSFMMAVE